MLGRTVGRYHIVAKLGEGGMGSVWKAEDPTLRRMVALKFLPRDLVHSDQARRRFLREARATSALQHPGIATLFDVGESLGELYIAIEFVEGETISDLLTRGLPRVAEALRIAADATEALAHAHARGVIHRDVTSRNIMLASDDRVVVIDFGLASAMGSSRITSSGTTIGTVAYVAPEAARGDRVDHRSDIYGLGVVLYEMLTGSLPFSGTRPAAVLYAAMNHEIEPPSVRREIPEAIDSIVLKAMARDPNHRFATASEFGEALRASLLGFPTSESPKSPPAEPTRPSGDEDTLTQPLRHLPGTRRIVVLPFREAGAADGPDRPAQEFARGLSEALSASLARVTEIQVFRPAVGGPLETTEEAVRAARVSGANLLLTGIVRRVEDRWRASYSLLDPTDGSQIAGDTIEGRAGDLFAIEDHLLDSVVAALGVQAPEPRATRFIDPAAHERFLHALGHMQHAHEPAAIESAIRLLEDLLESEGESAVTHAALAQAYLHRFILTQEPQWIQRGETSGRQAHHLDPHSPEVLVTLGRVQILRGRYEEAVGTLKKSIDLRKQNPEALQYLSAAYERLECYAEAEKASRAAIALQPDFWGAYNRLGMLFFRQGRYEQAIEEWTRVVEIDPNNSHGHNNLASAFFRSDRLEEAADAFRRSIELSPTATSFTGLGTVLFYLGRFEEALEMFRRAQDLDPSDPRMWGNLGDAQRVTPGLEQDARRCYERAVCLIRERLQINPQDSEAWADLAGWLAKLGSRQESLHAIERALTIAPGNATCIARAVVVYHLAGEREAAIRHVDRSVTMSSGRIQLERDPELEGLREDARVRQILSRRTTPP